MPDSAAAPEPGDDRRADGAAGAPPNGEAAASPDLGLTLSGRLPCVGCAYDLQGLSVLGHCPECGTAVRAAILYLVDPEADALRPLHRPRIVDHALPLWAGAGFLAAACAWAPRLDSALRHQTGGRQSLDADWAPWAVLVFAGVSGVASLGLVHLLEGVHRRWTVAAGVAAGVYLPLLALLWALYFRIDPVRPAPYLGGADHADRLFVRLAIDACLVVILLGIRPNARLLVARCLALRTGRVDRQTILATVGAVGLMALGDLLRLGALAMPAGTSGLADLAGGVLIFAGSALFTVALAGATIDTVRIRRSILMPSPSIREVLGRP
ncbi:MAG: hypothetical protein ACF8QF_09315 [Phycisphaerales bacterium]